MGMQALAEFLLFLSQMNLILRIHLAKVMGEKNIAVLVDTLVSYGNK
jgi:hypothetical protein